MDELKDDIQGLLLNESQKIGAKRAFHHCVKHTELNSTQLQDLIGDLVRDDHMMKSILISTIPLTVFRLRIILNRRIGLQFN